MKRVIISSEDRSLNDMLRDTFTPNSEMIDAFMQYFDCDSRQQAARLISKSDNGLIARVMNEYWKNTTSEQVTHDLRVERRDNRWCITDSNGTVYRMCPTKKECIDRINNQTV